VEKQIRELVDALAGHGFSHAVKMRVIFSALAAEGRFL
jgi:hypothetical protein